MAKISEDTEVKLDLKTIGLLVGGVISLASMWFTLQGEIRCWGSDTYGQSSPPVETSIGNVQFKDISAGRGFTCALTVDGGAICWGRTLNGIDTPDEDTFLSLDAGDSHVCAVDTDQFIHCWGENELGESSPPSSAFFSVSAGHHHSCGLTFRGMYQCWGTVETAATALDQDLVSISAGGIFTYGLTEVGELKWLGNGAPPVVLPTGAIRGADSASNGGSE